MMVKDYGIKKLPATKRNPQANSILERSHQTIGNIIRTFQLQDQQLDRKNPWKPILAATMFAMRATYHTTLKATPAQLVFGRDAIMNISFQADWNAIKENKQRMMQYNNLRENRKRIPHKYNVGDQVLMHIPDNKPKFGQDPFEGPFRVVQVYDNGTIRIRKKRVEDTVSIRLVKPYKE